MSRPILAFAAALAVLLPAGARAQSPGADAPARFSRTGHYQLRINDTIVADAKLFLPPAGLPRLLVVAPGLPQAYLVTAGERSVVPVDLARVREAETPDDVLLAPSAAAPASGGLTIDGTRLRFLAGTVRAVVEPRDDLVGEKTADELLEFMPEYRRHAAAYEPRRGDLRLLSTLTEPAEIKVFFGTWCPHCEKLVPRLIRVAKDAQNPRIAIKFYGLPRKIEDDPLARQLKITAVPTGLVHRGGEFVGLMTGEKLEHPEQALAALLLFGESAGSGSSATARP